MKKIQIANNGLFNCKSSRIAALVSFLWLGGSGSSFGQDTYVDISAPANTCNGVTYSGNVACGGCEGTPTVYVDFGHDGEPAEPSVSLSYCDENGIFNGTYGETDGLDQGVNVLTPSDSCDDVGDSVSVLNDNGSWIYSFNGDLDSPYTSYCGFNMDVKVTCLPDGTYRAWETHADPSTFTCFFPTFTEPGDMRSFSSSDGILHIPDQIGNLCPPYTVPCTGSYTKTWNLYDPVSTDLISAGTYETVSGNRQLTSPSLTLTDSVLGSYTYHSSN